MKFEMKKLLVMIALTISLVLSEPQQYGGFEVYEYDSQNAIPHNYQHHQGQNFNQRTRGQEPNVLETSYDQTQPELLSSSSSCEEFWSIQTESNENVGVITIPTPDYRKVVLRAVLSIAARLPSVSFIDI